MTPLLSPAPYPAADDGSVRYMPPMPANTGVMMPTNIAEAEMVRMSNLAGTTGGKHKRRTSKKTEKRRKDRRTRRRGGCKSRKSRKDRK